MRTNSRQAGPVTDPNELVDLVVERTEGITATFADGHVAAFGLEELRRVCPCATCRSLRDRGEDSWPRPSSPLPLSIADARFHGGWGLNVTWNDDHSTGIYPFEALRRLSEAKPTGDTA